MIRTIDTFMTAFIVTGIIGVGIIALVLVARRLDLYTDPNIDTKITYHPGFGYGFQVDSDRGRFMSQQHYLTHRRAKRAARRHLRKTMTTQGGIR